MIKLTEKEAAALFAQIKRPMPRAPGALRAAGTAAVERALAVHEAGVSAVTKELSR